MIKKLTHTLEYDKYHNKWFCKCGYVLGTGHAALYALCPLRGKKTYPENRITRTRKKKRTGRKKAQTLVQLHEEGLL